MSNKKTTATETQHKGLKVVILSQLLVEAMDDIRGTTLYKAKVKQHGNILCNLLNSIARQSDNVYEENPELVTNIYNNLDNLVKNIAKLDMQSLIMLNQIHEHYSKNQEDWDAMFNVELVKLKE